MGLKVQHRHLIRYAIYNMILHIDKFSGVHLTLNLVRIPKKTVGLFVVLSTRDLINQ